MNHLAPLRELSRAAPLTGDGDTVKGRDEAQARPCIGQRPLGGGDGAGGACVGTVEVRVEDIALLFDPLDPFPLPSRDLARSVEAFILDWARELPREAVCRIVVHVPRAQRAPYFRSLRALARR